MSNCIKQINGYQLKDEEARNKIQNVEDKLDPPYTIGEIPPITKGVYDFTRANRLMFLPADQIIVEQSTDGGATWTSANVNDETKRQVFSQFRSYAFAIPLKNGIRSCDCMLRVTITGMKYNVPSDTAETSKYNYWNANYVLSGERYCSLSGSFFWVKSVTDYIHCKYEAATGVNPNDWQLRGEGFMSGWSGLNYVKTTSGTFGGDPTQTTNLWNHRYTFRTATIYNDFDDSKLQTSSNTNQQTISEISAIGDNVWVVPNNMMKNNHVYGWDINGNMTLQKGLYAADYIQSNNRMVSPIYYENGVALSNKYASKEEVEDIQETLADHNEKITAQGEGLTEVTRIAEGAQELVNDFNEDISELYNRVSDLENSGGGGGVDIDSFNRLSGEVNDLEESIRETDQQLAILQDNIYTQSDLDPYLDEVDTLKNNFEQTEGRIQRLEEDSVDLLDRVADLENSSPSSGGNSYKFKTLDRYYIGNAYEDLYLNLSQYMSNYDELMIIVRAVVNSSTSIGISNTSAANNSFLASTSVSGTTYVKITMNKTDEGNYAWNIGNSFGWSTSSGYSYLKYYTSSTNNSVGLTVVIHGR